MSEITAVLLAAGKGVRMRSPLPKVLHPVLGRALVEWVVAAVRAAGIERIVLVVPAEHSAFRELLGDSVHYAVQAEQRGTGDALLAARAALAETRGEVLVLTGDAPAIEPKTLRRLLAEHRQRGAAVTVLSSLVAEPFGYGRIVRDASGALAAIVEEKDATPEQRQLREINSGCYCFQAEGLIADLEALSPENRSGEYYLTDVVARRVAAGRPGHAVTARSEHEIQGVNDRVQLARVGEHLRRRIIEQHLLAGVIIEDPEHTYIEAEVEIGAEAQILPFCVLRRGVRIATGASVGPFAHLRQGTVLEEGAAIGNFVEVKNTRLGPRAKAKHLSYLGDADIGSRANIGAGTITANYDGVRKAKTSVGERAFIGSGSVLIAPLTVGRGAVTAAGAVVTKNQPVADGEVWAGVPARRLRAAEGS